MSYMQRFRVVGALCLGVAVVPACGGDAGSETPGDAMGSGIPASSPASAGDRGGFAPAVSVPDGGGEFRSWKIEGLRQMRIPSQDEVGIPAFPGARVAQVLPGGEMEVNAERHRYNPSVKLLTTDSEEEVAAFYRNALQGWTTGERMASIWLWESGDDYNPLDVGAIGLIPAVGIMPPGPLGRMMPEARTLIEIRYRPGG
jgi:hypothetical protein